MGIIRNIYALVAAKLAATSLDSYCEHQELGQCGDCYAMETADRFA